MSEMESIFKALPSTDDPKKIARYVYMLEEIVRQYKEILKEYVSETGERIPVLSENEKEVVAWFGQTKRQSIQVSEDAKREFLRIASENPKLSRWITIPMRLKNEMEAYGIQFELKETVAYQFIKERDEYSF
ncbi:MAG: hypothetical protein KM296_00180 [Brockia lithotrophica]|nr:hypothetical protein [Brockia lithotrophica]